MANRHEQMRELLSHEKRKFRVIVETFDTAEEAVAFREKMLTEHKDKLSYIQTELYCRDWRNWTFA